MSEVEFSEEVILAAEARAAEQSVPLRDLIVKVARDGALLVEQELELFKKEIELRVAQIEQRVIAFAVGLTIAFVGGLALTAALILLLAKVMDAWVAAGLVGILYVIGGAWAAARARQKLAEQSLAPTDTIRSVRADVESVKEAVT